MAGVIAQRMKRAMAGEVRALFNDRSRGERPVMPQSDGLFGPQSVAWRVHRDVTSMMVGGVAALLLQMLHPAVLAGVWDHSGFRHDMLGRLRRTARFIAVTTYGSAADATAALDRVRMIHDGISGALPDGTTYRASDPALLAWVHVCEVTSFLAAWRRYGEPGMTAADQDRYVAEMMRIATPLGANPVPSNRQEAARLIERMRPSLVADTRTREVAGLLLRQRPARLAIAPFQAITFRAAVDLLPGWARRMHGFADPLAARPLVRAGTFGLAEAVRWAFR
ncbi:oxygenase MpaB family protein [Hephaestia mangrovi]|uniref:oxygenase MpaB family protein n=1 Tax=Hephaestia mangrovi TaxID=2873268 RepID=UPI001CA6FA8A|nr:oxygenase MpaB family protein [Hephaestia mangrovi]MBY8827737.1 DUF2236 domain-containing protein [Hephaestia mangrovi]